MGTLRIVVDGTKCDGHGICLLVLPELIALDTWGYASLESDPIDDPKTIASAKRAVHACPAGALALTGAVGTGVPIPTGRARRVGRGLQA